MAAGRFREDLYYRLNVVAVEMPPLRARREDIPLLVEHLRERFDRRHGSRTTAFAPAILRALVEHSWPGNVRELANAVERLVLLAEQGAPGSTTCRRGLATPRGPRGRNAKGFQLPRRPSSGARARMLAQA